jgi:hypothetical protein
MSYTVLTFNLFGDGLRHSLDPRLVERQVLGKMCLRPFPWPVNLYPHIYSYERLWALCSFSPGGGGR